MGLTVLRVEVGNPADPSRMESLEFLVDSGAIYSVVPAEILTRLGIRPLTEQEFRLANGETIRRRKGVALFRLGDKIGGADVIFGEPGDSILLGALLARGARPGRGPAPARAEAHSHGPRRLESGAGMTRMSVRELRLQWPEAERKLAAAGEIVITRDSKPVARLLPYGPGRRNNRARFDPATHLRWLRGFWKGRSIGVSTGALLERDRFE